MAKILIMGNTAVVESRYTLDEFKTLEKYKPRSLVLYEEDGKTERFKVGTTQGDGVIGKYGVNFGSETNNSGKSIITFRIAEDVSDKIGYVEELIGTAIFDLNNIEANMEYALQGVEAIKENIRSNIIIL